MVRKILLVLICGVFLFTLACQTKERTGAAVGGGAGAGLGAILGGEEHRASGAVLGGLLGGAVGYFAGSQLTEDDQKNVYDVLEDTPPGRTESWTSETGSTYFVTPGERFTERGRTYRELDIRVKKADGTVENTERVAYKTDEGDNRWQVAEAGTADELQEGRGYYEEDEREDGVFDREPPVEEQQDEGFFD